MSTRTPARRATTVTGLALAALLGLSACGDGGSTGAGGAAYNEQDVTFVKDMRPHHEQAVEMADLVLGAQVSPRVTALAEAIKAAQEPEIQQLDALLAEFDVEAGSPGAHGGHGGGHETAGMMSDEAVEALEDATGAEAETLFLQGMLEHHQGAVEMATAEIDGGEHPQAVELARSIKADQEAEIAEMQQLLEQA